MEGTAYPYGSSREHLIDELRRVDQLVRAQTVRWRLEIAQNKPEELWGMIHVSDKEVDRYLASTYASPWEEMADVAAAAAPYLVRADALAAAIDRRVSASDPEALRLVELQRIFGLDRVATDLLLLALMPEMDGRYRRLMGYLQDDASRARPSVELLVSMAAGDPAEVRATFDSAAPLLRYRLLSAGEAMAEDSLSTRPVRVDDRIVAYLLDGNAPDNTLKGIVTAAPPPGGKALVLEPEQADRRSRLAAWLRDHTALVLLHGPYGAGKLAAAQTLCDAAEHDLLVADVQAALRFSAGFERCVDLVSREAMLTESALCWRHVEALLDREQPPHRLEYLVSAAEQLRAPVFLATESAWDIADRSRTRPILRLDIPVPGFRQRAAIWDRYLPEPEAFAAPPPGRAALADLLSNAFQFTPGQTIDAIRTARGSALRRDPLKPLLTADDLYEGCRRHSARQLVAFARRIEPRTELSFDDLVLPRPNQLQLQELRRRVLNRGRVYTDLGFDRRLTLGRGLIALFSGSSGTGKTMAAELLAREQRVDLYKVDLSAVVSKYVGDTEKNLARVFEEAEYSNAIIFFDEADALFGKRGDVKEARDRWANIEVNYLLQRVEEYSGVVILASNLRQNIDEAFLRRIHVIVEFPSPDPDARMRIWLGMFPPGVERPADDEIRDLAGRFQLPGGSIRNIVLDSAFRAIDENNGPPRITTKHLVLGAAREYQKLGKPITRGEFDAGYYSWIEEGLMRK